MQSGFCPGQVMFGLVHCVDVDGKSVLFLDGDTECFQWWQWATIVCLLCFVLPFPALLVSLRRWLHRTRDRSDAMATPHLDASLFLLEGPYTRGKSYWESVVYLFRLMVILPSTFVTSTWACSVTLTVICAAQALCTVLASPFADRIQNNIDRCLHSTLVVVSVLSVRQMDSATAGDVDAQRALQASLATGVPMACFAVGLTQVMYARAGVEFTRLLELERRWDAATRSLSGWVNLEGVKAQAHG